MKKVMTEEQFSRSKKKYYQYYSQIEKSFKGNKDCISIDLELNLDSAEALFDYVFQTGQMLFINDFQDKEESKKEQKDNEKHTKTLDVFLNLITCYKICNTIQMNAFKFLMSLVEDPKNDKIFMNGKFLSYIDPKRKHQVKLSSSYTDEVGYHVDIYPCQTNFVDILKQCVDSQKNYVKEHNLKKIKDCEFRFEPFYNKFYGAIQAKIGRYSRR